MTLHTLARQAPDPDALVPDWTLGDRMRKALDVSGTPVHEIAEYLDVSRQTIGRWLHDRGPVKRHVLITWAATTGVDLWWLETGTAGLENQTGRDQYAIRDSNPEPADMSSARRLTLVGGVNRRLSVNRIPAGWPIPAPPAPRPAPDAARSRHLSAVS
jgi:transcriptional regulator with XRE-family HTH domain